MTYRLMQDRDSIGSFRTPEAALVAAVKLRRENPDAVKDLYVIVSEKGDLEDSAEGDAIFPFLVKRIQRNINE